jgi:hypothetical protein
VTPTAPAPPADLFAAGGEAGELMRAIDWAASPLGPPHRWPHNLQVLIPVILASRFPMRILWGPDLVMLYNDSYRPILGASKHPAAMAARTQEHFSEVWSTVGPMFDRVRAGEAISLYDTLLPLDRNGYLEECYFTLSYSPIPDDHGAIGGVLGVVHETTRRVLADRRLTTLRALSAASAARTAPEACRAQIAALAGNPADLPFALIYLADDAADRAVLGGVTGLAVGDPLLAASIEPGSAAVWPFDAVAHGRAPQLVALEGDTRAGPYAERVTHAYVAPLYRPGVPRPSAYFVAGINPRRLVDEPYRAFLDVASGDRGVARQRSRVRAREPAVLPAGRPR